MKDNTFTKVTALVSLVISCMALYFSWSQYNTDYEKSVLVRSGMLPLNKIKEGNLEFDLEVLNTSKTNLQYFIRASTNMGCLNGRNGKPQFYPCSYESQVISLSKPSAGSNLHRHTLTLEARHGAVDTHPRASISPSEYYLHFNIIDASNGRTLYHSKCYYGFHTEAKIFVLDQPVIDTSGESDVRQQQCRA